MFHNNIKLSYIIFEFIILLYLLLTYLSHHFNIYFYIIIILTIVINIILFFSYISSPKEYKQKLNKNNINIRNILTKIYLVLISLYYLQDVDSHNLRWVIFTMNFKYTTDMLNNLEHLIYSNPYYNNILTNFKLK